MGAYFVHTELARSCMSCDLYAEDVFFSDSEEERYQCFSHFKQTVLITYYRPLVIQKLSICTLAGYTDNSGAGFIPLYCQLSRS